MHHRSKHIHIAEKMFERIGIFVFHNRWKVVIFSILLNAIFGLGLFSLKLNNNIEELYIHGNTETKRLANRIEKLFPDKYNDKFQPHSSVKQPLTVNIIVFGKESENLFEYAFVNEIKTLIQIIFDFEIHSDYMGKVSFNELCAKNNGSCVSSGTTILNRLVYRDSKAEYVLPLGTREKQTHERNNMLQHIANYTVYNNTINDARYIKFVFFLRQDTPGRTVDSRKWQSGIIKRLAEMQLDRIDFVYSHSKSFFEELGEDTYPDIRYFALSFTILMTYLGFLISGGDCVSKRVNIGRMGTVVVPLSILGAWGLLTGAGVEFTDVIGVMPYFAICHEINNVMVTLYAVSYLSTTSKAVDRVGGAMRMSGIPVTMITLVYIVTFSVGTASNFLVMKLLSVFTGSDCCCEMTVRGFPLYVDFHFLIPLTDSFLETQVLRWLSGGTPALAILYVGVSYLISAECTIGTVIFIYINHMLFFTACLAIHEQRIDKNRHFCFGNKLETKKVAQNKNMSLCFVCCCTGEKPSRRFDTASKLEQLTRTILSRFVLQTNVRKIGMFIFLGYLCVSIWQSTYFTVRVIERDLVTKESYFSKFHTINDKLFFNDFYLTFIIPGHTSGSNKLIADHLSYLERTIEGNRYTDASSQVSWISSYIASTSWNLTSHSLHLDALNAFLTFKPDFVSDIAFNELGMIVASRIYVKTSNIHSYHDIVNLKNSFLESEEITNDYEDLMNLIEGKEPETGLNTEDDITHDDFLEDSIVLYSPSFMYIDKYFSPLQESGLMMGVQIAISELLLILTCPHPLAFIHGLLWFFSMWIGIIGFVALLGISMDSVVLVILVLGSSYIVEVTIHSLYSFYHTNGIDRRASAYNVLITTSMVLFSTLLAAFIGLVVLLVAESYVFRCVFKIFSVTTAVCWLHSFFFIPIGLSVLGPKNAFHLDSKTRTDEVRVIQIPKVFTFETQSRLRGEDSQGNTENSPVSL